MRLQRAVLALGLAAALGACGEEPESTALPPPQEPTREAVGHYCGMIVVDHSGPKGQIFLEGAAGPIWFSSVRDTLAFTMLPEEPKDIAAIYVNDMGTAQNWDQPEAGAWVEARQAVFVVGSDARGGMGAPEAVPFSTRAAAERFQRAHGGMIYAFHEVPDHSVLGPSASLDATAPDTREVGGDADTQAGHGGQGHE